ncbi:Fur family transcriptional regulator [Aquirufa sp. A-Brett2-W8]|jgi:Fur family ferric uptake transcriptional regulator
MSSSYSLSDFDLRPTPCRLDVLSTFQGFDYALSQGDIEQKLSDKYDRVTIYRTLKTFLTQGLLHKVLDDNGGVKYALCKELCHQGDHQHQHDHVHFKCNQCGQTTCLETVHIPSIVLPAGFSKQESNLLIQGTCSMCRV